MAACLAATAWAAPHPAMDFSRDLRPALTVHPRLGDRFYVESVLGDIFGPAARPITFKLIVTPASSFGGPCDIQAQVRVGPNPNDLADPHSACPGGKFAATLPMIGTPNMVRQGYVTRACEQLVASAPAMDHALGLLFGTQPPSQPEEASLLRAFQLFNPERQLDRAALSALAGIAAGEKDLRKRWTYILLGLCLDPQWQLI
ncbi:MAG: hypothetical protein ACXWP5_02400 [Bdellovibrionota bacterium]